MPGDRRTERTLRRAGALDFDDLLLRALEVLKTFPDARASWQQRFQFIHVDEYQDTNRVQYDLLRLLAHDKNPNLFVVGDDDDLKSLLLTLPGNVRAEISMARTERYEKAGKPPQLSPATIIEDLKRRDFTVNAMALSLNPGSRGLLMDPFNGAADIEAKVLRILHNYAFVEDPSRLIRAARFAARFHWPLEERTQARFDSARENNYIEYITHKAIGSEIAQLAYEEDPLHVVRTLEKEGIGSTMTVVVPEKALKAIKALPLGDDDPVEIRFGGGRLGVEAGGAKVVSQLLNGTFPNWERVVPSETTRTWSVEVDQLVFGELGEHRQG